MKAQREALRIRRLLRRYGPACRNSEDGSCTHVHGKAPAAFRL